jgi:hypothetical protein
MKNGVYCVTLLWKWKFGTFTLVYTCVTLVHPKPRLLYTFDAMLWPILWVGFMGLGFRVAVAAAAAAVKRWWYDHVSHDSRWPRDETENCLATLVTTKQQLEYFRTSGLVYAAMMASFCLNCLEKKLDFDCELYKLFDHSEHNQVNQFPDLFACSCLTIFF